MVKVAGKKSAESDAEHSYQLAMFVWYLNEIHHNGLDADLLIKYALVHDLVEVYAGDTDSLISSSLISTKAFREKRALVKLEKELKDFPEILNIIHDYEGRINPESRFVYVVDKLIPFINAYFAKQNDYYQKNKITYSSLRAHKEFKIRSVDPNLLHDKFVQETLKYLSTLKGFYYEDAT